MIFSRKTSCRLRSHGLTGFSSKPAVFPHGDSRKAKAGSRDQNRSFKATCTVLLPEIEVIRPNVADPN
jgi:hypothetical protein